MTGQPKTGQNAPKKNGGKKKYSKIKKRGCAAEAESNENRLRAGNIKVEYGGTVNKTKRCKRGKASSHKTRKKKKKTPTTKQSRERAAATKKKKKGRTSSVNHGAKAEPDAKIQ